MQMFNLLTIIFIIYEIQRLIQPKIDTIGNKVIMAILSLSYILWSSFGLFTEWKGYFIALFFFGAITSLVSVYCKVDKDKISKIDSFVSLFILLTLFYKMIIS